jgi:branched-chain amino acid transport system substrate-binding protein
MAKKISRRRFLKDAVVGGVALGAGLGSYRVTYGQTKKPAGTIKIGGQGAISGAHADYGWQMTAGSTMAIDEINAKGGVLGRKLEMKFMDEELKPATAVKNARYLVTDWGADVLSV